MDWNLKVPTYDFAEIEIGGEIEREPMSSGSSKRPRLRGCHTASCSVDGCVSDLSKCREYHRRHKVCEVHSKTAVVTVGGREQRFCQQCSRFHSLVEFDEVKRSCRKRLDGHNRRRRKLQPDSLNHPGAFANYQGDGFTTYGRALPTAAPASDWPTFVETKHEPLLYGHRFPLSSHSSLLKSSSSAVASSSSGSRLLDSDCALSLLSSSVGPVASSGDRIPDAHHAGLGQYSAVDGTNGDFDSSGLFQTLPFIWQ